MVETVHFYGKRLAKTVDIILILPTAVDSATRHLLQPTSRIPQTTPTPLYPTPPLLPPRTLSEVST